MSGGVAGSNGIDPGNEPSAEVLDAAIQWAIRLRFNAANAEACEQCACWRGAHPSHELAWQRLQWMCGAVCSLPEGVAARGVTEALAVARNGRRRHFGLLLAALTLTPLLAGRWAADEGGGSDVLLTTAPGDFRVVALPGGGSLRLNTNTAVRLAANAFGECIDLLRGEIFVTSASAGSSASTPLQVRCAFGRVFSSGGAGFAVRLETQHALVHVSVGEVLVQERMAGNEAPEMAVRAGECYELGGVGFAPAPHGALDPLGWLDRVVAARSMDLASFAAELSRYRHAQVSVAPEIRNLVVSGVFQVGDVAATLNLLTRLLPVRIAGVAEWSRMPVRLLARDADLPARLKKI